MKIQKVVRGWLLRKKLKKDLKDLLKLSDQEYLLMSNDELMKKKAARLIKKHIAQYTVKKKQERAELHGALTV